MKSMSAKEAKNGFGLLLDGLLLDTARAGPVTIEKHGRPVAVVLSTEEYGRLLNRQVARRLAKPGGMMRMVAKGRRARSGWNPLASSANEGVNSPLTKSALDASGLV